MRRRPGFILLMVLVLLGLAAAALAGVCRLSMRNAVAAGDEADDLQRRWGAVSCRATFLPKAEAILRQAEKAKRGPVASADFLIRLNGRAFWFRVADEQAKLNLNAVYQRQGRAAAERAARRAVRGRLLRVDLRPNAGGPGEHATTPVRPFDSFGEVFTAAGERANPAASEELKRDALTLTLWGDGKLNWRRASPTALELLGNDALGAAAVRAIQSLQSATPAVSLDALLTDPRVATASDQRDVVRELLTDGSQTYSVWVEDVSAAPAAGGGPAGRVGYHWAVSDGSADGPAKLDDFSW